MIQKSFDEIRLSVFTYVYKNTAPTLDAPELQEQRAIIAYVKSVAGKLPVSLPTRQGPAAQGSGCWNVPAPT